MALSSLQRSAGRGGERRRHSHALAVAAALQSAAQQRVLRHDSLAQVLAKAVEVDRGGWLHLQRLMRPALLQRLQLLLAQ